MSKDIRPFTKDDILKESIKNNTKLIFNRLIKVSEWNHFKTSLDIDMYSCTIIITPLGYKITDIIVKNITLDNIKNFNEIKKSLHVDIYGDMIVLTTTTKPLYDFNIDCFGISNCNSKSLDDIYSDCDVLLKTVFIKDLEFERLPIYNNLFGVNLNIKKNEEKILRCTDFDIVTFGKDTPNIKYSIGDCSSNYISLDVYYDDNIVDINKYQNCVLVFKFYLGDEKDNEE